MVCVNITNEELFFNAFPFENSYYCISGPRLRALDVVCNTGNQSSKNNNFIYTLELHFRQKKRYGGVWFNVISVTRGWGGVKFPEKKHLNFNKT